jgi:hypothetical protein
MTRDEAKIKKFDYHYLPIKLSQIDGKYMDDFIDKIYNTISHPFCTECIHYKENKDHCWGFCTRVGNEPVENTWYCAGFKND